MKKEIIATSKNSKLILTKSKNLMNIADKILAKKNSGGLVEDESWMQRLWEWADNKGLDDDIFPKDNTKLKKLESISFDYSDISLNPLPSEFGYLIHVKEIWFGTNYLDSLPKELLNLKKLEVLVLGLDDGQDISYNNFKKIPQIVFNIYSLKELIVGCNDLTEISERICMLVNLEHLCLHHNRLISVPKEIGKLIKLTSLDLSYNYLTELPKEIGKLIKLSHLDIQSSKLIKLPKDIVNLTNLNVLHLQHNSNLILTQEQIEWIKNMEKNGCAVFMDEDLLERTNKILAKKTSSDLVEDESWMQRLWDWADEEGISDLEWDDNDMRWNGLPRSKNKLINLTELNLRLNKLTELPKEIGNLINLTELDLWANELTVLPKEIWNLTNLTELYLMENQLTELPKEIENLTNLTGLYLMANQLTELPKEIGNLINLTELDLEGNQLISLPKEIEDQLSKLEIIGCRIIR